MSNEKGFWAFVERFKLLIEIVATLVAVVPVIWAGLSLVTTGLNAIVPAWSVLVAVIAALVLGYLAARGPKVTLGKLKKSVVRREFFSAIWDVDEVSQDVDGPFCKTCSVRMNSEQVHDRYARIRPITLNFVCRNPSCEHRGTTTKDLPEIESIEEAWRQVKELMQAEKRREEIAK